MWPPTSRSARLCLDLARKPTAFRPPLVKHLCLVTSSRRSCKAGTTRKGRLRPNRPQTGLLSAFSQLNGRFGAVAMTAAGRLRPVTRVCNRSKHLVLQRPLINNGGSSAPSEVSRVGAAQSHCDRDRARRSPALRARSGHIAFGLVCGALLLHLRPEAPGSR
jgi:hypothetical protein